MNKKTCKNCGREFTPTDTSAKVRAKRKYCSFECAAQGARGVIKPRSGIYKTCKNCHKEFYVFPSRANQLFCGKSCRDEYTPADVWNFVLQQCIKSAKCKLERTSKEVFEVSITVDDLKRQWEKQQGVCAYSGYPLILPDYKRDIRNDFTRASVDRIDSSKGYIKGNIQFVSKPVNLLKGTLASDQVMHFFDTYYEMRKFAERPISKGEMCQAKSFWL